MRLGALSAAVPPPQEFESRCSGARAPEQRPERATSRFMAEMEPQDDSLTNDELAAKVETMERTCELLDEQLAAMRAAESAL